MSGRKSRRKGSAGERAVANLLKPIWPDARRGDQRRQKNDEADVEKTPLWIEVKTAKVTNVQGAMKQGRADAAVVKDKRPVVAITKRDREPRLVTMDFDLWFDTLTFVKQHGLLEKLEQVWNPPE